MAKKVPDLNIQWSPRGPAQQTAKELWRRSRVMFLVGPAGGGKSSTSLGLALTEMMKSPSMKLILSRPQITVDEDCGFLPGTLLEKLSPWLGPIHDVFSTMNDEGDWDKFAKLMDKRIDCIPTGMLRGRTVRNSILILDEGQNCTLPQLKCALTRIGEGGRIIITGDADQSDRFDVKKSPLMYCANQLEDLDTVSVIRFTHADQQRDPLVNDILDRI